MFAAFSVNVFTVTDCEVAILLLSKIKSVPDIPAVPWICAVVPALSTMRKYPATPAAVAVPVHVPSLVLDAEEAAFIQSAGKAIYKAHQNQPGSVVVTYEVKDSMPIVIPVHPNQQKTRTESFNVVASMYPKNSGNEPIEMRWKREGLLLWESGS